MCWRNQDIAQREKFTDNLINGDIIKISLLSGEFMRVKGIFFLRTFNNFNGLRLA